MTGNSDTATIYLVDDDAQVLKAQARLLREHGFRTVVFESAETFLAGHDPSAPGCLVLDVNLPGLDGLALQRRLAADGPSRPIVFLTGHGDIPMSVRAIKAGAVDFLTKPVPGAILLAAVRAGIAQDAVARHSMRERDSLRQRLASLTPREREVLAGIASGKLNKQIAGELGVAEATVKFHRARLMERMQARTAAELMHFAARLELNAAAVAPPEETADRAPTRS